MVHEKVQSFGAFRGESFQGPQPGVLFGREKEGAAEKDGFRKGQGGEIGLEGDFQETEGAQRAAEIAIEILSFVFFGINK